MEQRTITQSKVYVLRLNRMTGKIEHWEAVAASYDKNKLIEYYNNELAENPYKDDRSDHYNYGNTKTYSKVFKKDGPLEWFNPIYNNDFEPNSYGQGIGCEWVTEPISIPSGLHFIH